MSKLNDKQLAFCRNLVQGMSQTEAYIKAGYSARGARHHAARMVTNGNILEELARLRQEAESAAVMSRQERMEWLTRQVRMSEGADPTCCVRDALSCVQELNKMDGAYKPEEKKLEVTGEIGVSAILGALSAMDMEPLVKE